jgi:hypothetical protein
MSRSRSGRNLLALALALALGAILAGPRMSAAEPRAKAPSPQSRTATVAPWDLFAGFWSFLTKAGCTIDPHGRCLNDLSPAQLDSGCGLDPHGRCLADPAPAQADTGCTIDPHGGCKPGGS